jgi:hypothetical protein
VTNDLNDLSDIELAQLNNELRHYLKVSDTIETALSALSALLRDAGAQEQTLLLEYIRSWLQRQPPPTRV